MALGGSGAGGGGGGAKDVKAGGAFVVLYAKDGALQKGLAAAEARVRAFGRLMIGVGARTAAAGGVAAAPILGAFQAAVGRGARIRTLADALGATAEQASAAAYAFEQAGVDLDGFAGVATGLGDRLSAEADAPSESFVRLGLNGRKLIDMPLDKRFEEIADAVAKVAAPADQAKYAQELLGEAGLKLLPTLKQGAAGFRSLAEEAGGMGAVLSGPAADAANRVERAFSKVWRAVKYAGLQIGEALLPAAPAVELLAGWFTRAANAAKEFIAANRPVVAVVAAVGIGLVLAGTALGALGVAATAVGAGIGVVASIAAVAGKVLAGVFAFALSPIGLVLAGVAGVTAAFLAFTDTGRAAAREIGAGFTALWDTVRSTWGGIVDAVKAGDLALAGKVAVAGLNTAWRQGMVWLTEGWVAFKGFFVDAWKDMLAGARLLFNDWGSWVEKRANEIAGAILVATGELSADEAGGAVHGLNEDAEKRRLKNEKKIREDRKKDQDKADAFRDAQVGAAKAAEDAARAALDQLVREAKEKADAKEGEKKDGDKAAAGAAPGGGSHLAAQVKGLFQAGNFQQSLRYGDQSTKRVLQGQLAEIKNVVKGVDGVIAAVGGLKDLLTVR